MANTPNILDTQGGSVELPKELKGKDAFKIYTSNQLNASSILSIKMPGVDEKDSAAPSLATLLQQSPNQAQVTAFKANMQNQFTLAQPRRPDAKTQFERDYKLLEDAIKAVPPRIKIRDLSGFLTVMKEDALDAIKADQDAEMAALKAYVATPAGLGEIESAFNIDAQAASGLADHLIKKLEDSHTKQTEDFKSSIDKAQDELRQSIAKDRVRIAYLNKVDNDQKDLKKQIDAMEAKNAPQGGPARIQHGGLRNRYKNIKPSNLQGLTTVTGRGIKIDGSSMTLDVQRFPNTRRYLNRLIGRDKDELDLLGVAALIRAEGFQNITTTITGSEDEDRSMELARSAYKAAILAGFPPENITIKWIHPKDGEKMLCGKKDFKDEKEIGKPASDVLFANGSLVKVLAQTHKKGEAIRAEEAQSAKSSKSTAELRQELNQIRANAAPAPQGAVAAPPMRPGVI
ncbi:MAG: hypothetical protein NTW08_06195 [Gammaproteobacteria bacterium]|nr:hypothetical protein [Gammaproteobacteria bacterium]